MNRRERWEEVGGTLLLRHILCQAAKGIHYSDAGRHADTAETFDLTSPLVAYKNAWIRDMLDYEQEHGKVPNEEAKRQWEQCIARADAEVNQIRRQYAAGKAA